MKTSEKKSRGHGKKSIIAFTFLAGTVFNASAQESTSAAGQTFSNSTAILSWNLGEPFILSSVEPNVQLNEGFEQAGIIVTAIPQEQNNLMVNAYPNPANASVTLDFSNANTANLQVHDMSGRLVIEKINLSTGSQIDFSTLQQGMYVLTLTSDKNEQKKIQIQKIH